METPPVILRRLAERLRGRRLELALTLKELAARAGVSQRFLVSVEAAKGNISVVKLDQVAPYFCNSDFTRTRMGMVGR